MQRKLPATSPGGGARKGPGNGHLAARPARWGAPHAFQKPGTTWAEARAADQLTAANRSPAAPSREPAALSSATASTSPAPAWAPAAEAGF